LPAIVRPVLREGAVQGAREYPKIIAERGRSSSAGCWREFLRLAPNADGSATLAVCRYEALANADEFVNEHGEFNLPDSVAGKIVVGVEDGHIVGGALVCNGSLWTFRETEISRAIDWLRVRGWVPTNSIVAEMLQAAFACMHHGAN
jgi:hypothetical protein